MFIDRLNGVIIGAFARSQYEGQESISLGHDDYILFRDGDPKERRKAEITAEADTLCDNQTGYPRIAVRNIMMVAMDINTRGKAGTPQNEKDAAQIRLDALTSLGDYIIAVRAVETNSNIAVDALADGIDPQTITPSWPNAPT